MLNNELKRVRLEDTRGSPAGLFVNAIRHSSESNMTQMVMCIVPNQNKDIYDAIKRTCCIENSLPSQVITSKIIDANKRGKTMSVLTKVALQMNCKLGGELWSMRIKVNKF